jgi:phosphohistidine phosphatase
MMPGAVSLPFGFGHGRPGVRLARASKFPGASINDVIPDTRVDPLSGTSAFEGAPVRVRPVGPSARKDESSRRRRAGTVGPKKKEASSVHLYVMRHGIALERGEWGGAEESRPLTEDGKRRISAVVQALSKDGRLEVDTIWSSPLERARQTAEIAGTVLGVPVELSEALVPGANVEKLARALTGRRTVRRLLVVGHEPDCGELVAGLIGDGKGEYPFRKAGIALLEGTPRPGGMKLHWQLAPRDVIG